MSPAAYSSRQWSIGRIAAAGTAVLGVSGACGLKRAFHPSCTRRCSTAHATEQLQLQRATRGHGNSTRCTVAHGGRRLRIGHRNRSAFSAVGAQRRSGMSSKPTTADKAADDKEREFAPRGRRARARCSRSLQACRPSLGTPPPSADTRTIRSRVGPVPVAERPFGDSAGELQRQRLTSASAKPKGRALRAGRCSTGAVHWTTRPPAAVADSKGGSPSARYSARL